MPEALIGRSPAFVAAKRLISRIAACDAPVVIEGETGTGKELAARAIHYQGARQNRAFVPVNCGAFPDTLIENELFGHKRGAFTDARTEFPGLLRLADGGTLFLDEVDSLTLRAQGTLLRFLQDRRFRPLGSRTEESADVRIVAAANRDLARLVDGGAFRSDLLFRLKVLFVELPPLRQRPGDPELLADHFIEECHRRYGRAAKGMHESFRRFVNDHSWPGNVRELENFIHREFLLSDDPELCCPMAEATASLPSAPEIAAPPVLEPELDMGIEDYRTAKARVIEAFNRDFLRALLARNAGNVSRAARASGKERRALGKLLKKYGIKPVAFRNV
jgi:transcriptional regulator with GAF, ATPase, and Fis domain